jgi:dolichol-phosphate mannosyltransferase
MNFIVCQLAPSFMTYGIVIPTYNEHGNIQKLVERILALHISDLHIIIVDDNSPDGTGAVAEAMATAHEHVHVIHRQKKEGLGKAYIAGFHKAFALGADVIQTMDADFSHDPDAIPVFS